MKRRLAALLLLGVLLSGCVLPSAPEPSQRPGPGTGNGNETDPEGPGTPALLWVRGASYKFNVTDAAGRFVAVREYTVMGLNSSTGSPCWEVRREEARPAANGTWTRGPPASQQYNASTGALCAWTWLKDPTTALTVHFQPHILPFWPPDTQTGLGDAYWNDSRGRSGSEVDSWAVSHEGRTTLRLPSGDYKDTEVYKTSIAVTGEALRRESYRVWYSPQVQFFLKRVSLGTGETEEFVVGGEPVRGLTAKRAAGPAS